MKLSKIIFAALVFLFARCQANINQELVENGVMTEEQAREYKEFMKEMSQISELGAHNQLSNNEFAGSNAASGEGEIQPIAPGLFEGDLILTHEQMKDVLSATKENHGLSPDEPFGNIDEENSLHRKKRKMISDSRRLWPTTIPYTINGADAGAVERGLDVWRQNTCLKFNRINGGGGDHIQFIRGGGCYSSVGRVGGRQDVSIGTGCTLLAIVAHEVGHALGFWHEQNRPDRDPFIRIMFNNIQGGMAFNFEKRRPGSLSVKFPYDMGSVMHYGPKAFSINGRNTIETVDPNAQGTIGQRSGLSFYDIKFINDAYCSHVCRGTGLNCQHNGYPDPKNCNRCRCPEGFGGTNCERAERGTGNCGQTDLVAGNSFQTISASGGGNCYYHIKAAHGKKVHMEVQQFRFNGAMTCGRTSLSSYLEIKSSRDLANTGPRMCSSAPRGRILSETNEAMVIFKGSGSFSLRYRQDPATGSTLSTTPSTSPTTPPTGPTTTPTDPTTRPTTIPTTPPSGFQCKVNGYQPDPTSCSHFYNCVGGVAHRFSCPSGLHYNARAKVCDWPASAGCQ